MRAITLMLLVACLRVQTVAAIPVELFEADTGNGGVPWKTELITYAIDGPGQYTESFTPVSIPFSGKHEAISGATTSSASYSLTDTDFTVNFSHYRERRAGAYSNGAIYFSPGVDADYLIAGSYVLNGSRDMFFYARLVDITANETLFENQQITSSTINEVLTLGENGGDRLEYAVLTGAISGSLYQNHQYQFIYHTNIISTEAADTSASATGFTSISFVTAVPEPGTWTLLIIGLGLLGPIVARRKRGC